jgi:predicted membrane protein
MEWYIIIALILLIILFVVLGILLACMLSGQRCTVSIQKRKPNHELTKIQQEQEQKRQKKLSTKVKRAFSSSSKTEKPLAPVEDVETVEFTLKLGDDKKDSEPITTISEASTILLPATRSSTQAERDARKKRREELRQKYNL